MFVSIATRPGIRYPTPASSFSPDLAYPEYPHGALSPEPNPVYTLLRELLAQSGLDVEHFGTAAWNPLRSLVPEGATVFVLCNFVCHRRPQESEHAFYAKCTHGSVLRALIDYLLLAVGPAGRVRFGNAPLQSCRWEDVQRESGALQVARFYAERGLPVEARDLRMMVTERLAGGRMRTVEKRDAASRTVDVELGAESLLSELGDPLTHQPTFRVTDYDPSRTEACHRLGVHRYVMHRDVLESDVVFSLPKLKTHEKVGITCGLKGFVGSVGHKDCLAHHRFGSPRVGGDEYPAELWFLQPLSSLHDWVYRRPADAAFQGVAQIADRVLRTAVRRSGAITTGAWHGNDTAWRMALDLARILLYADAQGVMRERPQRTHLSLIDGIVAGEAEGPLDPRPVDAGTLLLGDDVPLVDRIACRLMGFDPDAIPLVREAFQNGPRPISRAGRELVELRHNGVSIDEASLEPCAGRRFVPPRGWRSRLSGG